MYFFEWITLNLAIIICDCATWAEYFANLVGILMDSSDITGAKWS